MPVGGGDGHMQFAPVGDLVFESQVMPGYGKKASNYAEFVHPAIPEGFSLWQPETPKAAKGTEANTGVIYSTDTIYIEDGEQCGGLGGICEPRDVGQPTKPCIATPWPLAVCASKDSICTPRESEGNYGNAKDNLIFRCGPKTFGKATAAGPGKGATNAKPAAAVSQPATSADQSGKSGTPDIATGGRKLLVAA